MIICVAVDCKSDDAREGTSFYKSPKDENLKQQCLIKIKGRNLQSIQHDRMCLVYCFS